MHKQIDNIKRIGAKWRVSFLTLGLISLFSNQALSATETSGFWKLNSLPGVSVAYGTTAQQNGAMTNPDVFCAGQGNGYVLPRVGQWNIAYLGKPPLTGNNDSMNRANYRTRKTGSLVSEWGSRLSLYTGSGWLTSYWVAEPHSASYRHIVSLATENHGNLLHAFSPNSYSVACVRPLL